MLILARFLVIVFLIFAAGIGADSAPASAQITADSGFVGVVTDSRTGRPIAGAKVVILARDGETIATASSDRQGRYSLAGLAADIYRVEVRADGYRSAVEPSLRLVRGKTTDQRFILLPVMANIEEIEVTARALDTGNFGSPAARVLSREEIRRAPGTAGDIFRGLSTLPGVIATGEFSNFSVRGRGPRDNLIFIDNVPYDRAVHFDQSLGEAEELGGGGRFSIFGQNVVGQAEFQPGGWGAQYGGANGSLLRLGLADGNSDTPFFSIKADLAGIEFLYDGPTPALENTSMLVSARYFNFGPLFDLIGQEDIGTPELADLIIKTRTQIDADTTLSFLAIYTPEWFTRDASNVIASPDFEDVILLTTQQHAGVVGATLEQLVGNSGQLSNTVYVRFADDDSRQGEAIPELSPGFGIDDITGDTLFVDEDIIRLHERELEIGWRLDYSQDTSFGELRTGLRAVYLATDYQQSVSRPFTLFEFDQTDFRPDLSQAFITLTPEAFDQALDETALRLAAYVDQEFLLGDISITPGVRIEYDGLIDSFAISPRLQADWQASARSRLSATAGIFLQPPRILEIAGDAANLDLSPERMLQVSLGWEQYLGFDFTMITEVYYQDFKNLLTDPDFVTGVITSNGVGRSYGIDWALTKAFSGGWSATARYSYLDATRNFRDGQGDFNSDFSRPHLANITVNYEPNQTWAFALQYQIATGRPTDSFIIRDNVLGDGNLARSSRELIDRNANRLPGFQTLNFRVDYRKSLGRTSLIAFIDIINILGRENRSSLEFSPITGTFSDDSFGVFPQLGITLEF